MKKIGFIWIQFSVFVALLVGGSSIASAQQVLLADDFEDGTLGTPEPWSKFQYGSSTGGGWVESNGRLSLVLGAGILTRQSFAPIPGQVLEVEVIPPHGTTTVGFFNGGSLRTGVAFGTPGNQDWCWVMERGVNVSASFVRFSSGTTYRVRLVRAAAGWDAYLNGKLLWANVTDDANYQFGVASADQTAPVQVLSLTFSSDGTGDSDRDGLIDSAELGYGTNPADEDSDNDLLKDGEEVLTFGTNPLSIDTDGDGWDDRYELHSRTDPLNAASKPQVLLADDFEDGMLATPEPWVKFQIAGSGGTWVESDGRLSLVLGAGILTRQSFAPIAGQVLEVEFIPPHAGTYVGLFSGNQLRTGLSFGTPGNQDWCDVFANGTAISGSSVRFSSGTINRMRLVRTDSGWDVYLNNARLAANLAENLAYRPGIAAGYGQTLAVQVLSLMFTSDGTGDSDQDGLIDSAELGYGTNPADEDSDNDLLKDGEEVLTFGTNPLSIDTDGDGWDDRYELHSRTDPLNAASKPQVLFADDFEDGILATPEPWLKTVAASWTPGSWDESNGRLFLALGGGIETKQFFAPIPGQVLEVEFIPPHGGTDVGLYSGNLLRTGVTFGTPGNQDWCGIVQRGVSLSQSFVRFSSGTINRVRLVRTASGWDAYLNGKLLWANITDDASYRIGVASADQTAQVQVLDIRLTAPPNNLPPVAKCNNVTVFTGPTSTSCDAPASIDDGSFDPDGDPITKTQSPAGPYPVGNTSVTLTVTDSKGASSSCAGLVTVKDNTPPKIFCFDKSTTTDPGKCSAVVKYSVSVSDNCSVASLECTPPSGSEFPKGDTTVNCTAKDAAGNTATCSFTVTVVDQEPPETTISSAVDGDGKAVANAGPTLSKAISITFTGMDACGSITFECSLDGSAYAACANPQNFQNLGYGTHTFRVRANDSSWNSDPTPATFGWTVLSPKDAANNLIGGVQTLVNSGAVNSGNGNALISKLEVAIQQLGLSNDTAAINQLQAFINQVNALLNAKKLTSAQADALINAANDIISHIGN